VLQTERTDVEYRSRKIAEFLDQRKHGQTPVIPLETEFQLVRVVKNLKHIEKVWSSDLLIPSHSIF
jgi:hypothetical protein